MADDDRTLFERWHDMWTSAEYNDFCDLYGLYVREMTLAVVLGQLIFVVLASSFAVAFFPSMFTLVLVADLTASIIFPLRTWASSYLNNQPQALLDLATVLIQIALNSYFFAGLSAPYFLAFFSIYALGLLALKGSELLLQQFTVKENSLLQPFFKDASNNKTSLEKVLPSFTFTQKVSCAG